MLVIFREKVNLTKTVCVGQKSWSDNRNWINALRKN